MTFKTRRPLVMLELHKDSLLQRFNTARPALADQMLTAGYKALILTDHEDNRNCSLVPVDRDSPFLRRQETDMLLFY